MDNFNLVTTGLGAGSYPEAPPLANERVSCCMCGNVHTLRERNGHILCRACENEFLYATSDQETQLRFIKSDYSVDRDFLLNHWWEELDEPSKMAIAEQAFKERYRPCNYISKDIALEKAMEKRLSISLFVRDCSDEFGNWYRSQEACNV